MTIPIGLRTLAEIEREAIFYALEKCDGDKLKVAKVLGIGKTTLYRKMAEYRKQDAARAISARAELAKGLSA